MRSAPIQGSFAAMPSVPATSESRLSLVQSRVGGWIRVAAVQWAPIVPSQPVTIVLVFKVLMTRMMIVLDRVKWDLS